MKKLVNESINEKYSTKPAGFMKALTDLTNSLTYLNETDDEDLWFLKKNPDIKRILESMYDLYFELGDHLNRIDWGKTDWHNLKKWKWEPRRSFHYSAPGSGSR